MVYPYSTALDPVQTVIRLELERDHPWLIAKFPVRRPWSLSYPVLDRQCRARDRRWCGGCQIRGRAYRGHLVRPEDITPGDRMCRVWRRAANARRPRRPRSRSDMSTSRTD